MAGGAGEGLLDDVLGLRQVAGDQQELADQPGERPRVERREIAVWV